MHRPLLIAALICLNTVGGAASAAGADVQWPRYNNDYAGQRFSPLADITPANVTKLAKSCTLRLGDDGPFETGPIVIDGTMFVTTTHTTVALDATDCVVRWRSVYAPEEKEAWAVNRGAAYLDGRIYRGTGDGRFLALDAKTGAELWRVKLGDPTHGEAISAAPIAWNGMVFIGMAVGDMGNRGRVLALDAATGKTVWQFNTIPMGDEFGAETWKSREAALIGGGATWSSYSLDEATGELLFPVGNPAPMLNNAVRPGDNLFTDSVVAVDAKTGKLKWWHQMIAADYHDWDMGAAPILYKTKDGVDMVAGGSKDGNLYGIDQSTHKLAFRSAVTTLKNVDKPITPEGVSVCPGVMGGVEWNGPAFDPGRDSLFVGAVDWCAVFKPKQGDNDVMASTGGHFEQDASATGWVTALDPKIGSIKWRYHSPTPMVAGVTPTASGLVLTGDVGGNLIALDSETGKSLLQLPLGGSVAGGVVTYSIAGKQYVAATAGNVSKITFASATGTPTIVIMALNAGPSHDVKVAGLDQDQPHDGAGIYKANCTTCHGANGQGANAPSLVGIGKRLSAAAVAEQIKFPRKVMPKLYPSPLSVEDVAAVTAYIRGF